MPRRLARTLALLCAGIVAATLALAVPMARAVVDPSSSAQEGAPQPLPPPGSGEEDRSFSVKLRDLFLVQDELTFFDRARARLLLARPTDGAQDPGGDGYRRSSMRRCATHVCVHHVKRGDDAPDSKRWVRRTLRTMERVWRHEVDDLGFDAPPSDRRRGGDGRFDVYLTDLGARGLFGYCAPERRARGERFSATTYCVLDNDFDPEQYGAPARRSLRVTAAHEFFHAIQFGYDYREDAWLLETTAVWMEESFADGANDSRRYLKYGNVRRPALPLDTYSNTSYGQYGNWPFWEFATRRHGEHLVRAVWRRADARRGARDESSVQALRRVLAQRTGDPDALRSTLARYAAANLDPARSYPEGGHWPAAKIARRVQVERAGSSGRWTPRVDHLAARHLALRPRTGHRGDPVRRTRTWRLQLRLVRPGRAAYVVTVRRTDGTRRQRLITDARAGLSLRFDGARVAAVVVSAVNTSARYRCGRTTMWACGGVPRDDDARFAVRYRVTRPQRR